MKVGRSWRPSPSVHINCDAPEHEPKVAHIGRFARMADDSLRSPWEAFGDHIATVAVDGDQVDDRTNLSTIDRFAAYRRYRLDCPLCRSPLVVRADRLWPLLETLVNHDIPSISFRSLSDRLQ